MEDTHPTPAPSPKQVRKLLERCRVEHPKHFDLTTCPTRVDLPGMIDAQSAKAALQASVGRLAKLQAKLYAQASWSVLIVLQAMDTGGKDGTIAHVMSGVNPQGVHVTPFRAPGPDELAHDFLWRVSKALPARGMIGIFNRSHYEEVLVPRVKPELLAAQHLPPEIVGGKHFWDNRLQSIADFERHLTGQGTVILKFFLHISQEEQRQRLLARLDDPAKLWKFKREDLDDRDRWPAYMSAYQSAIAATATKHAPWFVIPADDKPTARLLVGEALCTALDSLDLAPPKPTPQQEQEIAEARRRLGHPTSAPATE